MPYSPEYIDQVFTRSRRLFSADEIEAAIAKMAGQINSVLSDANPVLLTVMVGGLIPTASLLRHMSFPLEMDYVHATRYDGSEVGGEIRWLVKPQTDLKDRTVLLVDDILDGGVTLKAIVDYCQRQGAKKIHTAVLVEKQGSRDPEGLTKADFSALTVRNEYIYGYGMDFKRYLRNAPGIFVADKEDSE